MSIIYTKKLKNFMINSTMKTSFKAKTVQNLMIKNVKTLAPESTVSEAVKLMKDSGIGCVLVMKKNRLAGIFSERDLLVRVVAEGLNCDQTEMQRVMTKTVVTTAPNSSFENALLLSSTRNIRHLPVVDDKNELLGILSVKDLMGELLEEILPL